MGQSLWGNLYGVFLIRAIELGFYIKTLFILTLSIELDLMAATKSAASES